MKKTLKRIKAGDDGGSKDDVAVPMRPNSEKGPEKEQEKKIQKSQTKERDTRPSKERAVVAEEKPKKKDDHANIKEKSTTRVIPEKEIRASRSKPTEEKKSTSLSADRQHAKQVKEVVEEEKKQSRSISSKRSMPPPNNEQVDDDNEEFLTDPKSRPHDSRKSRITENNDDLDDVNDVSGPFRMGRIVGKSILYSKGSKNWKYQNEKADVG